MQVSLQEYLFTISDIAPLFFDNCVFVTMMILVFHFRSSLNLKKFLNWTRINFRRPLWNESWNLKQWCYLLFTLFSNWINLSLQSWLFQIKHKSLLSNDSWHCLSYFIIYFPSIFLLCLRCFYSNYFVDNNIPIKIMLNIFMKRNIK